MAELLGARNVVGGWRFGVVEWFFDREITGDHARLRDNCMKLG